MVLRFLILSFDFDFEFTVKPISISSFPQLKRFIKMRAIMRMAAGFLKLLFPNLSSVTEKEFIDYCLTPAIDLRQRLRDQFIYMDSEFKNYQIEIITEKSDVIISMEEPEEVTSEK
jgi:predicted ATP-dependent Lon-type protease